MCVCVSYLHISFLNVVHFFFRILSVYFYLSVCVYYKDKYKNINEYVQITYLTKQQYFKFGLIA